MPHVARAIALCVALAVGGACTPDPEVPVASEDVGEDCGAECDAPEDVPTQPDIPAEPDMVPDAAPDVVEPFDCPDISVEIEGVCVPDDFFGREGEALAPCPEGVVSPSEQAQAPECVRACRGPETPFGMLWRGEKGERAHAPVSGTVVAVEAGRPDRPEAADRDTEGCFVGNDGKLCCLLEEGQGNHIAIVDRKLRLWTLSHLQSERAQVEVGQVVAAGQHIAAFGDSGYTCDEGGRVHLSVAQPDGLLVDASACVEGLGGGVEASEGCFDADRDTYGVGSGCASQDCDDSDPALQAWNRRHDACMGTEDLEVACADRDGDGGFAGEQCPWPDEDCDDFDPQSQTGCGPTDCVCFEGPCCDGCQFMPDTQVCAENQGIEYLCPEGETCGADVYARFQDLLCSGQSAACDGALVWREPGVIDVCTDDQRCSGGQPNCVFDEVCAQQCDADSDCAPDQHCQGDTCLGDVCAQGLSFCIGNDLRRCSDNGSASEVIENCAFGCVDGACRICPDNPCQRDGLDDGDHCLDDTLITCALREGCRFEVGRASCEAPTPLCHESACVACRQNTDCPSPLQACEGQACLCQHECTVDERGCEGPDLQWRCAEDVGGCRHRVLEPCGEQEICDQGTCVGFCDSNHCEDNGLDEGAVCDGDSRVVCGLEGECAVETSRDRCRGDTRRCTEGACVACLRDSDCRSSHQSCIDNDCVCNHGCEADTSGCLLSDRRWVCQEDNEGCRHQEIESCDPNERCEAGECVLNCEPNFCLDNALEEGDHCDGDRRVRCRLRAGCPTERSWQQCTCGCTEGACDPCNQPDGPYLIIGTGESFTTTRDGDTVGIFPGFQGGHHVFGALRAFNIDAPEGTNQLWRITERGEELAFWSVVRNLTPVADHHEHQGETVQFFLGTPPESLDGLLVTLEVTLTTLDNHVLHDEVDLILSFEP